MKTLATAIVLAAAILSPVLAGETETFTGNVTAINAETMMVTVKADESEVSFAVNEKTEIMRDGSKIELSEIKAGDSVTVNYTESDGSQVAVTIGVHTDKA